MSKSIRYKVVKIISRTPPVYIIKRKSFWRIFWKTKKKLVNNREDFDFPSKPKILPKTYDTEEDAIAAIHDWHYETYLKDQYKEKTVKEFELRV